MQEVTVIFFFHSGNKKKKKKLCDVNKQFWREKSELRKVWIVSNKKR